MGLFDLPITSQTTSGLTRSKKGDGSEVDKWLQRVSHSVLVGAIFLLWGRLEYGFCGCG